MAALAVAFVLVGVIMAALPGRNGSGAEVTLAAPKSTFSASAASQDQPSDPSPCIVTHTKTADPAVVLLGDMLKITLGVEVQCPETSGPLQVVLVLDGSGSMVGGAGRAMKLAATDLVRMLGLPTHPQRLVGVVEFRDEARTLASLTNDRGKVLGAINQVGTSGDTRIDLGILEGLRNLTNGGGDVPADARQVLVVFANGANTAGCAPVLSAAQLAKDKGVIVAAVCLWDDCDIQCLKQAASPGYFFKTENASQLQAAMDRLASMILRRRIQSISVMDEWGDNFAYVADSASPPHTDPVTPTQWLRWIELGDVPSPLTYTLLLRPLRAGTHATNVEATGALTDSAGLTITWTFRVPMVTVIDPTRPTPTATRTSPSATPSSTPTQAATPSPTLPPLINPTIYLPATYSCGRAP